LRSSNSFDLPKFNDDDDDSLARKLKVKIKRVKHWQKP
jgi:hypothetical protein